MNAKTTDRLWALMYVRVATAVLVGLSILMALCHANGASQPDTAVRVDRPLQQALLSGDWKEVYQVVCATPDDSAVTRLIKAHACLALNFNDESACLFHDATPGDLESWRRWSADFANSNLGNPTAVFLAADALARVGSRDAAVIQLSTILRTRPDDALALNLRGVIEAMQTNFPAAEADFASAESAMPHLADAWCNAGMLAVQEKEGATGALHDFESALHQSRHFATAQYGRGCMKLALCQWGGAQKDLNSSLSNNPCLGRTLVACLSVANGRDGRLSSTPAYHGTNTPGMQLMADVERFSGGDWGFQGSTLKDAFQNYSGNARDLLMIRKAADVAVANNPALAPYVDRYWKESMNSQAGSGVLSETIDSFEARMNASAGSRVPGFHAGLDTGLSLSHADTFNHPGTLGQWNNSFDNFRSVNDMISRQQGNRPSGFDAAQHDAVLDSGHWAYVPVYGLFPAVPSGSQPADKLTANNR